MYTPMKPPPQTKYRTPPSAQKVLYCYLQASHHLQPLFDFCHISLVLPVLELLIYKIITYVLLCVQLPQENVFGVFIQVCSMYPYTVFFLIDKCTQLCKYTTVWLLSLQLMKSVFFPDSGYYELNCVV